ncbi:MAG: AbrB/MazE/SpoVT family DNA-binding domain-containing protein [Chloroflexi bacterium]|nr:AbrB/MazE/SpoVT family DNA-binding domain-containing protein [Chloroflexota bacterium]
MTTKLAAETCCEAAGVGLTSLKVEWVIGVDERGQMVLPKELREKAKIKAGDKLAVVNWEKDGQVCCITLIKTDELAQMVRGLLGPLAKELI